MYDYYIERYEDALCSDCDLHVLVMQNSKVHVRRKYRLQMVESFTLTSQSLKAFPLNKWTDKK